MSRAVQLVMDRLAIGISAVCALHCMFTPLALVLLPALAATPLADEAFHRMLLLLVVPSSALALTLGCRRHKDRVVLMTGIAGLSLITFAAFAGHELLGEAGERAATLAGALTLAFGHLRNYSLCRRDLCDHA